MKVVFEEQCLFVLGFLGGIEFYLINWIPASAGMTKTIAVKTKMKAGIVDDKAES